MQNAPPEFSAHPKGSIEYQVDNIAAYSIMLTKHYQDLGNMIPDKKEQLLIIANWVSKTAKELMDEFTPMPEL